jgi:hypothetical protein
MLERHIPRSTFWNFEPVGQVQHISAKWCKPTRTAIFGDRGTKNEWINRRTITTNQNLFNQQPFESIQQEDDYICLVNYVFFWVN